MSSAVSWECCLRMDRPQPAVRLPRRVNARLTMGELGTLLGLQSETRHSSSPHTHETTWRSCWVGKQESTNKHNKTKKLPAKAENVAVNNLVYLILSHIESSGA